MMRVVKVLPIVLALAVMLGWGLPALANEEAATFGTVKSVSPDQNQIVVTDKDGKDFTYMVKKDAKFILPDQNWTNSSLRDIKAGENVSLLWDKKDNHLETDAILVRSGDFKNAGLAEGKVKSVDAADHTLVATDRNNKEWTYHMGNQAKVRLNDRQANLNEVKANEEVIIVWEKSGDQYRVLAMSNAPGTK